MKAEGKITPKGAPLTLAQILELATIRQSDVDEMVRRSPPSIKPFINAVSIRPK